MAKQNLSGTPAQTEPTPSDTALPRRLRRKQAAEYLGTSMGFLEKAACRGNGPPMIRISARLVLYDRDDLDRWAAAHRVGSTAEAGSRRPAV